MRRHRGPSGAPLAVALNEGLGISARNYGPRKPALSWSLCAYLPLEILEQNVHSKVRSLLHRSFAKLVKKTL